MHKIFRVKAYEQEYGPHFNEEHARKAVSKMQNEDGSRGPHWSLEETTSIAGQYNVKLNDRFNKYDWFVALNMIYSDYFKVITTITNQNNIRHFVEFAKAWLNDRDVDEGKMWYYYIYVICDKLRDEEMECYEQHSEEDYGRSSIGLYRKSNMSRMKYRTKYEDDYDMYDDDDYDMYSDYKRNKSTRFIKY